MAKLTFEVLSDGKCEVFLDGEPIHGPLDSFVLSTDDHGTSINVQYTTVADTTKELDPNHELSSSTIADATARQERVLALLRAFPCVRLFRIIPESA